ncbi:hypothetical protein SOVF_136060 isoform B [Spinacia oleracea]|nr:hypothetical protein SOVF_136060 isoform B [Spinacia oleracea]
MDAAQWPQHQQIADFSRPMEEIAIPNNPNNNNNNPRPITPIVGVGIGEQRKARPQKDQNVNCPRCNSTNTKFCYYNNYSLTQPRYFCKTCRRYWTQGGSLRNVPVGGGSRKNKRSSSSNPSINTTNNNNNNNSTNSSIPNKLIPDLNPPSNNNSLSHLITSSQNPKFLEGHDLNLAFPMQGLFHPTNNENHEPINIMNTNNNNNNISTNTTTNTCSTTTSSTPISALELLRTGIASRGSMNPYVPMPMQMPMPDSGTLYPSGFPNLQEFKPNMNNVFSSPPPPPPPAGDHHNNMVGSGGGDNNVGSHARLLFPFADMNKLASSTHHHHQEMDDQSKEGTNDHHHQHNNHHHHHNQGPTNGYWSGMLGGGTW